MATTTYFEEVIVDEGRTHEPIKLKFGTMTTLRNDGNLYLRIDDGDVVLIGGETGRRMLEQLDDALAWLGITR